MKTSDRRLWRRAKAFADEKQVYEDRQRALLKILGEPVVLRLDDELAKTRFRLLVVASLSVAIVAADLHIRPGSTLLGLQIDNLTDRVVRIGLAIVVGYFFVHFLWGAVDGFREWRLRLTGSRYSPIVGIWDGANDDGDQPIDPRNSTLYGWWRERAEAMQGRLDKSIREFEKRIPAYYPPARGGLDMTYLNHPSESAWAPWRQAIGELKESIDLLRRAMESPRIEESLERYERWHISFVRSENFRWIIFDFAVPIALGVFALAMLLTPAWQVAKSALRCFS
jgi:hypothetical protein